jgi:gamma-glutamyl-gamma-aminobutyrate hydrolase PuuD
MSSNKKTILTLFDGMMSYANPFKDLGYESINYTTAVEPTSEWLKPENIHAYLDMVDMLVLTGGEDISPKIYGDTPRRGAQWDQHRDATDIAVAQAAIARKIPVVGICRGGQLLNCLNGGKLWQDVDGHSYGNHPAQYWDEKERQLSTIQVSSAHHQMMIPGAGAKLLLWADSLSGIYSGGDKTVRKKKLKEPEVLFYEKTKSMCIQYHPEWMDQYTPGRIFFDDLILSLEEMKDA